MLHILDNLVEPNDRFIGAVFATYTCNLNFYEQLVAPRLYGAGATNNVILVDDHGYQETLAQSGAMLTAAGSRYACTNIIGQGHGVQHAKFILLVGSEQARLLLGSGNLTFSGFGDNLELFHRFDLNLKSNQIDQGVLAPFAHVWQLITSLRHRGLSTAAEARLDAIATAAPWLTHIDAPVDAHHLWHNWSTPLIHRFTSLDPVDELHIIAPFIDTGVVQELLQRLQPASLIVGVDKQQPNVDGPALNHICQQLGCTLNIRGIESRANPNRRLHAKTFIGIRGDTAWSITGSANCTRPALLKTWTGGGNLEYVVVRTASANDVLSHLWDDAVHFTPLTPESALPQPAQDAPGDVDAPSHRLRLWNLTLHGRTLSGQVIFAPLPQDAELSLELLRSRQIYPVSLHGDRFDLALSHDLPSAELAALSCHVDGQLWDRSPAHLIDQLEALQRFGHQSYHGRVAQELQSFDGAGRLFEELLDFLWRRLDPSVTEDNETTSTTTGSPRERRPAPTVDDQSAPPPVESFVTDEVLAQTISWRAGHYSPYDRSTLSLRDLLSLVLLRLTAPTEDDPDTDAPVDGASEDGEKERVRKEREKSRADALARLRQYLIQYVTRYTRHLANADLVVSLPPHRIIENHFTLCRILLEVERKMARFSRGDLRTCITMLYARLFAPQLAKLDGPSIWSTWNAQGNPSATLRDLWFEAQCAPMTIITFAAAWGDPPPWPRAIDNQSITRRFLAGRALIDAMSQALDDAAWYKSISTDMDALDIHGYRTTDDLATTEPIPFDLAQDLAAFQSLARYLAPVVDKYQDLFKWVLLQRRGQLHTAAAVQLRAKIHSAGYVREFALVNGLRKDGAVKSLRGDATACPRCFVDLPKAALSRLHHGELELCTHCNHAVLYWQPSL